MHVSQEKEFVLASIRPQDRFSLNQKPQGTRLFMNLPTPDPSQEGNRPAGSGSGLSSRERLSSWSASQFYPNRRAFIKIRKSSRTAATVVAAEVKRRTDFRIPRPHVRGYENGQ